LIWGALLLFSQEEHPAGQRPKDPSESQAKVGIQIPHTNITGKGLQLLRKKKGGALRGSEKQGNEGEESSSGANWDRSTTRRKFFGGNNLRGEGA